MVFEKVGKKLRDIGLILHWNVGPINNLQKEEISHNNFITFGRLRLSFNKFFKPFAYFFNLLLMKEYELRMVVQRVSE